MELQLFVDYICVFWIEFSMVWFYLIKNPSYQSVRYKNLIPHRKFDFVSVVFQPNLKIDIKVSFVRFKFFGIY